MKSLLLTLAAFAVCGQMSADTTAPAADQKKQMQDDSMNPDQKQATKFFVIANTNPNANPNMNPNMNQDPDPSMPQTPTDGQDDNKMMPPKMLMCGSCPSGNKADPAQADQKKDPKKADDTSAMPPSLAC